MIAEKENCWQQAPAMKIPKEIAPRLDPDQTRKKENNRGICAAAGGKKQAAA
ncbi:hypothetical protein [Herbaspirillum chlorophenolicum]|uniref:hypothetical protein n=1 Tax=Herbaspirillum chlorophenolicum TaxID=211589 RepID=UPI0012E0FC0A|nr:hypothetical protein [Herbaspirillum chlorophenolicum]